MKILIGGDTVPTQSNFKLFADGDVKALIGEELKEKFASADFVILNLEVPLTDKCTPIDKCGPNLIASTNTINGLAKLNPYFFGLANNHILDQDVQGLESTVSLLKDHGIAYAGVGKDLKSAAQPYIFEKDGSKIGIYCCAEHEFSIVTENTPGANLFDPLESLDHIVDLKKQCDYVVVLYHGGKEYYRYPSPYLQKVCRKMVDKGADLIVCQHSHCIGCEEKYAGGTIVYGQGNFLFDDEDNEYYQTSLMIELNINENNLDVKYIPIVKQDNIVRMTKDAKSEEILREFRQRSEQILGKGVIQREYDKFAKLKIYNYLNLFNGKSSLLFRILNRLSGWNLIKWFMQCKYDKQQLLVLQNCVECEAHRELVLQGIKK